MASPLSIVRALLEDQEPEDQSLPPEIPEVDPIGQDEGPDEILDPKELIHQVDQPMAIQGHPADSNYWIKYYSAAQRNRRGRGKLENHTYAEIDTYGGEPGSEPVNIIYHRTPVVRIFPDRSAVVTSGGWNTRSTLARLNAYLPNGWSIYQHDFSWYWGCQSTRAGCYDDEFGRRISFTDGDRIDASGTLHPQAPPEYKKQRQKKLKPG